MQTWETGIGYMGMLHLIYLSPLLLRNIADVCLSLCHCKMIADVVPFSTMYDVMDLT